MELKNFVFLVNVLCWGGYLVSFGMIKDTFPTVNCGYVSSKGHRTNQRDAVVHSSFVVHAVSYDMAMICDGCGKDNFAVNVVKDNMSGALQMALCNSQNDVKMAILWAFDNCEEVILKRQEDTLNASGVRIFLSLWDLTHKKEYLAQLGDCRLYILDNFRNIICETRDHKPSDKKEKTYIERCGGRVRYNGTYVGLISDNPAAYGLTTSRALGCAHLKQNKEYLYRPKRGPVNAVPDVWYLDLQGSGAVEMLITS